MRLDFAVRALAAALILALLMTGCSLFQPSKEDNSQPQDESDSVSDNEDAEYPLRFFGANLYSRPGIIVSLSPSITEKLGDLGLGDRLEGISDYCEDAGETGRARCGTTLMPDLERIESLSPHLLLTEAGLSDDDLVSIQQMGIEVAVIPRAKDAEQLKENYLNIATLLEGKKTGAAIGAAFNRKLDGRLEGLRQNAPEEPKNAIYLRLLDFTLATGDTLEGNLMELIGLNNIAKGYKNWEYPESEARGEEGRKDFVSLDFIFCDKKSVTIKMLEKSEFYKGLDAVLKDRYLYIDSSVFERQGLRMFDELERMQLYAKGEIPGSKDEE